MKVRNFTLGIIFAAAMLTASSAFFSCSAGGSRESAADSASDSAAHMNPGGPRLGTPGGGPVIDKSGDSTLQAMIRDVVPRFRQLEFKDPVTGKSMRYNLFSPSNPEKGRKYPLVLFIADASTPGTDVTRPLVQGYGALVWATDSSQLRNPCYVLVPQFSGVAVNDAYEHTDEVDIAMRLLQDVVKSAPVDTARLYTTGQSMGGMISMYYNVAYPDVFAASIFVDSHWATDTFAELARHRFVYFIAGDKGKAFTCVRPLEEACRKDGVAYTFEEWSARLPQREQSARAAAQLSKDAPVNMIEFSPGSVLPADGKGSEHMYSFDYAYRIPAVRDWLFRQSK